MNELSSAPEKENIALAHIPQKGGLLVDWAWDLQTKNDSAQKYAVYNELDSNPRLPFREISTILQSKENTNDENEDADGSPCMFPPNDSFSLVFTSLYDMIYSHF